MRNIYIVLFFLFFGILSTKGQEFRGGVLGGLATTEISGDRLQGPNKAGIYAGAYVYRYFSPNSSFQMELDFIQKGSRENPDSSNAFQSYLLRLNYVEIPVHYKYDFIENATLETGLSLGVLVSSYEAVNTYEWVSGSDFDQFDLSFNVGLYYTLLEGLRINVRYSNSILPVRPHAGGASWRLNKGQYNEVLSFVLFLDL
ncbi:MAG: outer membrane beta-barrel protein [Bacteroidales bacterium]|nr:outer membrane beta-barrel protein [Bacteroidales bacterium]